MAKKEKAVYAPGELSRVRDKLGVFDHEEAKQLAQKLGGEVGYERTAEEEKARLNPQPRTRHERVEVKIGDRSGQPKRRVELPYEVNEDEKSANKKSGRRKEGDPLDDPSVQLKQSYWDRIKLDRFAGSTEFEIKTSFQVFQSMISFLGETPDYVSPMFVNRRMAEYYKKIEVLVVSTRNLLPRNNAKRSERIRKNAPMVFLILDAIRYWDIEGISGSLTRIQSRPRHAKAADFADILRAIYKPLFILDRLDFDAHIRGAFKILYKFLYVEDPVEAQNKHQELIRMALAAFSGVSRDIHYLLYPLLMKTVSTKYLPYRLFFAERKRRIMAFLNVTEDNQIVPADITIHGNEQTPNEGAETAENAAADASKAAEQAAEKEKELSEEEKARRTAEEAEKRALERGLQTLEVLFPKAGWDKLHTYPDLYPYFVETFNLKKGIVNIAPTDPLLQIFILMRILEELFFGIRYVSFGSIRGPAGTPERIETGMMEIVNDWNYFIQMSFEKEYLPRMGEYVRILEGSAEERNSAYTKKLAAELHWTKRLYFLPYYKFETLVAPPFQKREITSVYNKVKILRRYLTAVAAGIELGNKAGGAEVRAPCDGIENPWESYVFQVPNPLSIRLDALLAQKARNNASLIYFCLAVTAVLDYLVNNEESWAYSPLSKHLFRSVNGDGIIPLTGVDDRIDAEALFKQSLKQRQKNPE